MLGTARGENRDLVYVGLEDGRVLVVSALAGLPVDGFRQGGAVAALFVDVAESALYLLPDGEARLEKYDLVSKKRLAVIDLPAAGFDVAIMGE